VGRTAAAALEELHDYHRWRYEDNPWGPVPDFLDPQVLEFRVPVRPEYQEDGRRYPCDEAVVLRVLCVRGRQEQGLLVCVLPTIGRLTDRHGRLTTFRSAVIVMTSNLGARRQESFGFGPPAPVPYEGEALAFFRPEFFNRIDAVVTFQPLSPETVRAIARKELAELAGREGLARRGLRVDWSDALVDRLAHDGFDARYGARPLQRTTESLVVTPLARFLLDHPDLEGATLRADLDPSGQVTFFV
jgi:hypothetical protein